MCPVLAQSHPWTNVPSVDGASNTVGIFMMQEWCAKVGRCVCCECISIFLAFVHGVCMSVLCVQHTFAYMCSCV